MYLLNNQAIISLHKYLLQAPTMAGALRIELRPDDLESSALTFTLHPNILGGPDLPWAAAMPTSAACWNVLASGIS